MGEWVPLDRPSEKSGREEEEDALDGGAVVVG